MISIAMHILIEHDETREERAVRRYIRDHSNPLELGEPLFRQHYRLNKPAFKFLLDTLTNALPATKQKFAIAPMVKLAACLRFFAEGAHQKGVGKDYEIGLAQSSFSLVLSEVLNIFEELLCPVWITWPTTDEQRKIAQYFYTKYKLPGVVGCVDGTHINIVSPATNKHLFYNRKGACSVNALLVCDNELRIRFIDATHPGACHDSFIWNVSDIKSKMERDYLQDNTNVWLLGDAGYPLEPWLLTPYRTPDSGSPQAKFNDVHSRARNIIERTNGVLKNRWRCLLKARELYYTPAKAIQIINVCAALHNICIYFKSDFNLPNEEEYIPEVENIQSSDASSTYLAAAQRIRTTIANTL